MSRWLPLFIAVVIAAIATLYYLFFGSKGLDINLRQLRNQNNVEKTSTTDQNTLVIKCKNGESYEIVYKESQNNFTDLVYNKCGTEGVEQ